ncbi:transposase DDE domain protein [archaeon]|nr:transposase DDE domain protein [archaeon]
MNYPQWVLKHKKKGTEIRKIGNNFYLYKVTSVWDKEKKRARKITEKFLGTITQEGLIKPRQERLIDSLNSISVKEFGATNFILELNSDIKKRLKTVYPDKWKELFVFSVFRLLYNTPIKNLQAHYATSFISETLRDAHLSPKTVRNMLREVGKERGNIKAFIRQFISGSDFAIIDLTHVFSLSENVISSVPGYNSKKEFLPQIHMIFLFSLDQHTPSYFRMVPGSIRDVSPLVLTVKESGVNNVVLIGDKGFYSENNVLGLEAEKLHYILPLKRNSSLIDYSMIQKGDRRALDGYFMFEKRTVWYYSYKLKEGELNGKTVVIFIDERLKAEEEKDYLSRIEKEDDKALETFFKNQYRLGTIAVITDMGELPERIYSLLKSRGEIERMFDTFKNVLNADRTYMKDDYQMEGWMFINFISLIFYYKIYSILKENKLLKKYSPNDVLIHLSRIYKLKVQEKWITSEIPKKTKNITEKLNIHIT